LRGLARGLALSSILALLLSLLGRVLDSTLFSNERKNGLLSRLQVEVRNQLLGNSNTLCIINKTALVN
jgi:hypothetical protein